MKNQKSNVHSDQTGFITVETPPILSCIVSVGKGGNMMMEQLIWKPLKDTKYSSMQPNGNLQTLYKTGHYRFSNAINGQDSDTLAFYLIGGPVLPSDKGNLLELLKAGQADLNIAVVLDIDHQWISSPLLDYCDIVLIRPQCWTWLELQAALHWLIYDIHAMLTTKSIVCMDFADVRLLVGQDQPAVFAVGLAATPLQAARQACRILKDTGLLSDELEGVVALQSGDHLSLVQFEAAVSVICRHLSIEAIAATTRAYSGLKEHRMSLIAR